MVCERAGEHVAAGLQAQRERLPLPGEGHRKVVNSRTSDPLEVQVVLVLAEVGKFDADGARRDSDPREPVVELERNDLDAGERRGGPPK
jgi:hypothetical protein